MFKALFSLKEKLSSPSNQRALDWLKKNIIAGEGIIVSSKKRYCYPEVTGYIIPTLYQCGEKELAGDLADWLVRRQNGDGSFSAPDGTPYTFDTGQVMRGFVAVLDDLPQLVEPLKKGCDWILTQVRPEGRLDTPSTKMWGSIADDRIHLYVLSPLLEAGEKLGEQKYINAACKVLEYYSGREGLIDFNTLSHFYAYIIEALCDLRRTDLAKTAMEQVAGLQRKDGSVPAYKEKGWVCLPGLAQFAVIWYKLGVFAPADKAMAYLEKHQNKNGGFNGSRGRGANYFPKEEISWGAKFFLDAYSLKIRAAFDREVDRFSDAIDENDGRVREILDFMGGLDKKRVLDVGCGKGRFLRVLKSRSPQSDLHGLDISEEMLAFCPEGTKCVSGSILDIKYPDRYFDAVYCVETLEHAVNTEKAVQEMARVLKPGGKMLIIDKNIEKRGKMRVEAWERWFKAEDVMDLLKKHGVTAQHKPIAYGKRSAPDGLFIAWEGVKE